MKALTEMALDRRSYEEQIKLVTHFVNDLCYAAGDQSYDLSFYRRRASLLSLYTQTMLVFVGDDTHELQQTRRFIERNTKSCIW